MHSVLFLNVICALEQVCAAADEDGDARRRYAVRPGMSLGDRRGE